jgi:hypothetical protein
LWDSIVGKRKEKEIASFFSWALAMVDIECAKSLSLQNSSSIYFNRMGIWVQHLPYLKTHE